MHISGRIVNVKAKVYIWMAVTLHHSRQYPPVHSLHSQKQLICICFINNVLW